MMITRTEGNTPRNSRAVWSVAIGLLSFMTVPAAVLATRYSDSYELLHAGFAIPVALLLGGIAVASARRARARHEATLGRAGGLGTMRVGRLLGILGVCIACSGLVALAVYGVLTYIGSQE
jgi:hypothetical protein